MDEIDSTVFKSRSKGPKLIKLTKKQQKEQRQQQKVSDASVNAVTEQKDGWFSSVWSTFCSVYDIDPDEELHEVESFLTYEAAVASENPERVGWSKAIDGETLKQEIFKTFKKLSYEEAAEARASGRKITPLVLLHTKKRDKTYKARIVILAFFLKSIFSLIVTV